jgi:FKBP-type peptidyl-prolyl cis-trans isomerase
MNAPTFAMPAQTASKSTPSGLSYEVIQSGTGKKPKASDRVTVHYAGWTTKGKLFDSSYGRGQTATFGLSQVIRGWTEGLQLMEEGAIYKFVLPPALAYGASGAPPHIGPNETLVFQVELIKVG